MMDFEWNNQICKVYLRRTQYKDGSLYVYLVDDRGKFFSSLTSDTYYSPYIDSENCAYVSISNIEYIDKFIVKNKIGKSVCKTVRTASGAYILYEFDLDAIKEESL
jgi:hypothetical protein